MKKHTLFGCPDARRRGWTRFPEARFRRMARNIAATTTTSGGTDPGYPRGARRRGHSALRPDRRPGGRL